MFKRMSAYFSDENSSLEDMRRSMENESEREDDDDDSSSNGDNEKASHRKRRQNAEADDSDGENDNDEDELDEEDDGEDEGDFSEEGDKGDGDNEDDDDEMEEEDEDDTFYLPFSYFGLNKEGGMKKDVHLGTMAKLIFGRNTEVLRKRIYDDIQEKKTRVSKFTEDLVRTNTTQNLQKQKFNELTSDEEVECNTYNDMIDVVREHPTVNNLSHLYENIFHPYREHRWTDDFEPDFMDDNNWEYIDDDVSGLGGDKDEEVEDPEEDDPEPEDAKLPLSTKHLKTRTITDWSKITKRGCVSKQMKRKNSDMCSRFNNRFHSRNMLRLKTNDESGDRNAGEAARDDHGKAKDNHSFYIVNDGWKIRQVTKRRFHLDVSC